MKERLDVLLVNKGLAASREKAKTVIMAGEVFVNGQREDKAGSTFDPEKAEIVVKSKQLKYVSRGGLKLEKAVEEFDFSLEGKICMDIGASTGGFTDCMLQNGAKKVYSVDVGHGQLDWKLRNDERVVCMEKTNFRYMSPQDIDDEIEFASCDVSFISLTKILLPARRLLKDGGQMVVLIKPQFEAGKDKVGKKGVVREEKVHVEVVEKIVAFARITGFDILRLDFSPIRGPEGNIEYLIHLSKNPLFNEKVSELDEKAAEEKLVRMLNGEPGSDASEDITDSNQYTHEKIAELVSRTHEAFEKNENVFNHH